MQLFLDCDGVLADFDKAFEDFFGMKSKEYEDIHGSKGFWKAIETKMPNFFRELPLMPDAKALYESVKHMRPIILTGCPKGGWAEMQKIEWAREHFPGVPMIVCRSRDKRIYCQPGDILIDDITRYKALWESAGGRYIVHTSAEDSVNQLMKLV